MISQVERMAPLQRVRCSLQCLPTDPNPDLSRFGPVSLADPVRVADACPLDGFAHEARAQSGGLGLGAAGSEGRHGLGLAAHGAHAAVGVLRDFVEAPCQVSRAATGTEARASRRAD